MKITLEQIQRQTDPSSIGALIKKNPIFPPVCFHVFGYCYVIAVKELYSGLLFAVDFSHVFPTDGEEKC